MKSIFERLDNPSRTDFYELIDVYAKEEVN